MNDRKKYKEYPSQKGFAKMVGLSALDPLGSYTGRPAEEDEQPVQDVDDL